MLDVRKLPGTLREREQSSRFTLSHWALWKLSHNSSPAVISSSSLPCHTFFSMLGTVSCWRKRLKLNAKDTRQERHVFPEPPPPLWGHLLDQVWRQYLQTWEKAQKQVSIWNHTSSTHFSRSHCLVECDSLLLPNSYHFIAYFSNVLFVRLYIKIYWHSSRLFP